MHTIGGGFKQNRLKSRMQYAAVIAKCMRLVLQFARLLVNERG